MTDDLLEQLLATALHEGVVGPSTAEPFARALRDRAAAILAERVRPLEERAAAFEKESAWLRQQQEAWEATTDAYGRLLAHHRDVLSRVAAELEQMATASPSSFEPVRARLGELAAVLRAEVR